MKHKRTTAERIYHPTVLILIFLKLKCMASKSTYQSQPNPTPKSQCLTLRFIFAPLLTVSLLNKKHFWRIDLKVVGDWEELREWQCRLYKSFAVLVKALPPSFFLWSPTPNYNSDLKSHHCPGDVHANGFASNGKFGVLWLREITKRGCRSWLRGRI